MHIFHLNAGSFTSEDVSFWLHVYSFVVYIKKKRFMHMLAALFNVYVWLLWYADRLYDGQTYKA